MLGVRPPLDKRTVTLTIPLLRAKALVVVGLTDMAERKRGTHTRLRLVRLLRWQGKALSCTTEFTATTQSEPAL